MRMTTEDVLQAINQALYGVDNHGLEVMDLINRAEARFSISPRSRSPGCRLRKIMAVIQGTRKGLPRGYVLDKIPGARWRKRKSTAATAEPQP